MTKAPDIDKSYVSPYDQFLRAFDAKNAPTPSQQKEKLKHEQIFKLRDKKTQESV